jgi:hypothetical protein
MISRLSVPDGIDARNRPSGIMVTFRISKALPAKEPNP